MNTLRYNHQRRLMEGERSRPGPRAGSALFAFQRASHAGRLSDWNFGINGTSCCHCTFEATPRGLLSIVGAADFLHSASRGR